MGRIGKFTEFKPARRVFAGRGRSLLTFGEWKIAFLSIAFGAAIGAGWFYDAEGARSPFTLIQPAMLAKTPRPEAESPIKVAAVETPPVAADEAPAATQTASEAIMPQIILAAEDGRESRTPRRSVLIAPVARIVDGDTLYLEGVATRIRLWGVDAPEKSEAGFDAASDRLAALVGGGPIACEHVDTDPHKRIVARCFLSDGADLSEAMIKSGVAREFLRFTRGYYGGE